MSRTRSLSFPRINYRNSQQEATESPIMSPYHHSPAHSRDSSASSASSPLTPTFSRGHTRWPSSTSSLITNPDSPATAPTSKTTLTDLVEEPAERDDLYYPQDSTDSTNEPMCICDTILCEHRQKAPQSFATPLPTPPEWTPGDDYFNDGELHEHHVTKRQKSGDNSTDSFASRLSRHFPSIKKRFHGHRPAMSVSSSNLHSAPPSRSSSLRLPATRSVTLPAVYDMRNTITPPFSPATTHPQERSMSPPRTRVSSQAISKPVEIDLPTQHVDPIDREGLASTPLLPPTMAEYFNDSSDAIRSPLQSPTIAAPSTVASMANTPIGTPVLPGFPTPPLSAKPSMASLRNARSGHAANPLSEIPPLTIAEETDPWAIRLGHANFTITPEPYMPGFCDRQTCKRLQDDWEAARVEYMRQAARISEHYGVTSQTYKLTKQKWAEIDAQWRANHEQANAEAQAMGDSPVFQPLAETQPLSKMPSLNDPQQPSKFPAIEEKDIVGPMVRYAKIQHDSKPSRKPAFLRIFTDPSSLLSGRSSLQR